MSGRVTRAAAQYRRNFKERVIVSRATGTGAAANIAWDETRYIRAHIRGYAAAELAGEIVQGDQEVMLLTEDMVAMSDDIPPRKGDRILMPSRSVAVVQSCDSNSRRMDGETIAYVCRVRGP